jgi:hypothetical protein
LKDEFVSDDDDDGEGMDESSESEEEFHDNLKKIQKLRK